EERGNKGAALTTFISLAGRYLVLMPNNPRAGGISRRVEGDERTELRDALSQLTLPDGMGLIVRTAGVGQSAEELQWDLDYLLQVWGSIESATAERPSPFLIYQESNIIIRAIRDYFRADINEILIDTEEVYQQARDFMTQVMPRNLNRVKFYDDQVPLFSRYQIETKIESALGHSVRLPSGGSIVIDYTEALVSVDINSSRATKGSDIEETALNTNLEAADEIARQLRIRDIGGLIVIDFIDMTPNRNQREVENRLREALKLDRARVQVGRISRFGLLEMSRQRLRPSLGESSLQVCPRCNGQGHVRSHESLSLSIMRVVEEEAIKEKTGRVVAKVPVSIATFLLNEKREAVNGIESSHGVQVLVIPDPGMDPPNYTVERVRDDDAEHVSHAKASYELPEQIDPAAGYVEAQTPAAPNEPAVRTVVPPPRAVATPANGGFFARIMNGIFGRDATDDAPASPARRRDDERSDGDSRQGRASGRRQGGNERRRGGSGGATGRRGGQGRRGQNRGENPERTDPASADAKDGNTQRQRQKDGGGRRDRDTRETKEARDDSDNSQGRSRSRGGRRRRGGRGGDNRQRDAERAESQSAEGASRNDESRPANGRRDGRRGRGDQSGGRSRDAAKATDGHVEDAGSNKTPERAADAPPRVESGRDTSSSSGNDRPPRPAVSSTMGARPVSGPPPRSGEPGQSNGSSASTNDLMSRPSSQPSNAPSERPPARPLANSAPSTSTPAPSTPSTSAPSTSAPSTSAPSTGAPATSPKGDPRSASGSTSGTSAGASSSGSRGAPAGGSSSTTGAPPSASGATPTPPPASSTPSGPPLRQIETRPRPQSATSSEPRASEPKPTSPPSDRGSDT
ncbi:MAG: Rne/Rng family ribonuclease, partial [Pseudomonadota bacterium]